MCPRPPTVGQALHSVALSTLVSARQKGEYEIEKENQEEYEAGAHFATLGRALP